MWYKNVQRTWHIIKNLSIRHCTDLSLFRGWDLSDFLLKQNLFIYDISYCWMNYKIISGLILNTKQVFERLQYYDSHLLSNINCYMILKICNKITEVNHYIILISLMILKTPWLLLLIKVHHNMTIWPLYETFYYL